MSAVMALNTRPVYVELLDEGTTVIRPSLGESLGGDVYRLLPTTDYDYESEHWEFPPGSIVRCVKEIHDAEELLVAREAVADAAHKIAPIHESGLLTASESTANLRTRLS